MFEFLLLTSIALIVFSQELPTEDQKTKTSMPNDGSPTATPKKPKNPVKPSQKLKKQPRQKIFDRAA